MVRQLIVAVGLWTITSGCATHRSIQLDPPDQTALAVIAVEVGDGPASLELDTAAVPVAFDVRLGVDSMRWRTRDRRRHAIDPARIRSIKIRDRGRGFLDGMLGGLGAAVLAGAVTAIWYEDEPYVWIPAEYVVGVRTAVVAIPVGALIGVVWGHRVVFRPR